MFYISRTDFDPYEYLEDTEENALAFLTEKLIYQWL